MSEKERIVQEACAQADEYMEQSKDHVARMVDDNEITRNAMQMGEEIIARAEETAQEIHRDINEYADGVLSHMEIVLKKDWRLLVKVNRKSENLKCKKRIINPATRDLKSSSV